MRVKRKLATVVAATALLTGTGLTAGSTTANAVTCPSITPHNYDTGGGEFKTGTFFELKSGPYSSPVCNTVNTANGGSTFYFWCWNRNAYGHYWVYGRVANTQNYGWTSDDNFSNYKTEPAFPSC
jgi:hypothetical protein